MNVGAALAANNAKRTNWFKLFGVIGVICGNKHSVNRKQFAAEAAPTTFKIIWNLGSVCSIKAFKFIAYFVFGIACQFIPAFIFCAHRVQKIYFYFQVFGCKNALA